jgi:hypothetical protein
MYVRVRVLGALNVCFAHCSKERKECSVAIEGREIGMGGRMEDSG